MKADYKPLNIISGDQATGGRPAAPPVHPKGSRAKVLLTSVFGPYAQDDEYGSRELNPMELYQNQVTRTQGAFSLRMFHRSWGIMMIQSNIQAPCTLLDFPELDRFIEEIRDNDYDIVGISAITPNILKVKKMCELIREHLPEATIVIGGHIANIPDLSDRVDADHCVKGEGVGWFRALLGEDTEQPIRHPMIASGVGTRNVGIQVKDQPGDVAATLIPSVGCPLGCNFCSTSAMFGGKGNFINFFDTGDELFDVMCQLEEEMQVQSFFVMDENFLFQKKRALRLLELMEKHDKAWSLYVFTSANVLRSYTMDQIVRLGIAWVWMGIEGKDSQYSKLRDIDTFDLVKELQGNGVRVLGSTIIALENHTPENIDEAIEHAAKHDTDFHQFMLYTPIPGTPLHAELTEQGLMKDESEFHVSDIHGQYILNYRHPHLNDEQTAEFIVRAFDRDFEVNGPSTARITRTTLAGWRQYKDHPDARVRRRFAFDARELATTFSAVVGAAKLYYRNDPPMYEKMSALLKELYAEFGLKSRFYGTVGARYVLHKIRQEEKRLATDWTYEPPTFYERNEAERANTKAALCRQATAPPKAAVAEAKPARKAKQDTPVSV